MNRHLILKVAGAYDSLVTTDDLSPSGDAVAYRSNPSKLATFTMINKDPGYADIAEEFATKRYRSNLINYNRKQLKR